MILGGGSVSVEGGKDFKRGAVILEGPVALKGGQSLHHCGGTVILQGGSDFTK